MPAAFSTIQITDGTTTADLVDNTNYALQPGGWSPAVTYLRESTFGGQGPYEDVQEQLTFDAIGADAATALGSVNTISALLNYARRWKRGERVSAIRLKCQPQGSVLSAPLEAVITGSPGGPGIIHPATWNDELMIAEISDVQTSFTRRGAWIGVVDTVSGSAAANPNKTTLTLPSHITESPLRLEVALTASGGTISTTSVNQWLIYTHSPGFLGLIDTATLYGGDVSGIGGSGTTTTINDGANTAYNNTILRMTVDSGSFWTVKYLHPNVSLALPGAAIEVFAVVRNGATDFSVRCCLYDSVYQRQFPWGPYRTVANKGSNPYIVSLGVVTSTAEAIYDQVWIQATQQAGSSKALDINYLVTMPVEDVISGCVAILPGNANYAFSAGGTPSLVVDHQVLTKPEPFVGISTSRSAALDYTGNAFLTTVGTTLQVIRVATNSTAWRHVSSTGAVVSDTITAKRSRAYLSPQ
jgi:hypothetical protein